MNPQPSSFLRKASLLGPCVFVFGLCGSWGFKLRVDDDQILSEVATLERTSAELSERVTRGESLLPKVESYLSCAQTILSAASSAKWTPMLRDVALNAPKEIELLEIGGIAADPFAGPYTIVLGGVVSGESARARADRFRQEAEEQLIRAAGRKVQSRFKALDDMPAGPDPTSPPRASFSVAFEIAATNPTAR